MRRRGHRLEGPPRADGPYRAGRAGRPYLVPEVAAEPDRPAARHAAQAARARPLFRELHRHRAGPHPAREVPAAHRGRAARRAGRAWRGRLHRRHRRRGGQADADRPRPRGRARGPARGARHHQVGAEAQEDHQAAEGRRELPGIRQPARMDDPRRRSGDSARAASAGAARRRPLRDLGPQRPLPPRHQPQQPPEKADGAACAGHHRAQREAHAAGGGRRFVRQWPPRPHHHRRQQASAEEPFGHAEGQAGPLPPESARQARRLFGPLGHRHRSGAEAPPVRPAQEDGARAVQAVHLLAARRQGSLDDAQAGEEVGREGAQGSLGHPRRGDPRASGAAEPRADAPPPRHPGVRAGADRGQGDPAPSLGLRGVQRRFRRRPDGRARSAEPRGAAGSARPDDVDQQHPLARQRQADHRAFAGHGARSLLSVDGARRRARREHDDLRHERGPSGARSGRGDPAQQDHQPRPADRRGRQAIYEARRDDAGPDAARRDAAAEPQGAVRDRQPPPHQEGDRRRHRHRLPPHRPEGDGAVRRRDHGARLPPRLQGRHLLRQGRHDHPAREGAAGRRDPRAGEGL